MSDACSANQGEEEDAWDRKIQTEGADVAVHRCVAVRDDALRVRERRDGRSLAVVASEAPVVLSAAQEVAFRSGEGAQGLHHVRNNHERVHCLLAALLRARPGAAVHARRRRDSQHALFPLPLAGLRKLSLQPHHLRYSQPGFPETVPANTLLPVRLSESHDARRVLPIAIRRP